MYTYIYVYIYIYMEGVGREPPRAEAAAGAVEDSAAERGPRRRLCASRGDIKYAFKL